MQWGDDARLGFNVAALVQQANNDMQKEVGQSGAKQWAWGRTKQRRL